MNTIKCLLLTTALALVAGLCTGAEAQTLKNKWNSAVPALTTPEPISLKLNAIEVAAGNAGTDNTIRPINTPEQAIVLPIDPPRQVLFGYSFLGRTAGTLPGSFNLSMNCTPVTFEPDSSNEIVGGSWSLPVYSEKLRLGSSYIGALYGHITGGKMAWNKTGTVSTVDLTFVIDGGTQQLFDLAGAGSFQGTLTENEKGSRLVGELTITFK
jgi:hypothetical protein